jgi:predicted nucleic acid-binding protein
VRDVVFVDTSAFVALRNQRELEHDAARRALRDLVERRVPLLTSNYVFAETYTALLVRVGRDEAITWGRALRASTAIELVRVDEVLEEEAWSILESHADKRWSYVDATSFALLARERVAVAFSFDQDFAQRGLALVPGSERD